MSIRRAMASLVANLHQPIRDVEAMSLDEMAWWIDAVNDLRKSEKK